MQLAQIGGSNMLQNRKIALFVDVANTSMTYTHYEAVVEQAEEMGEILFGAVYGATDKRHRAVLHHANKRGFTLYMPLRLKKRGNKVFDHRILVDATEVVCSNPLVDTVVVVSAPHDMVHFYSFLRKRGIAVVACDNADEASMALVSEKIDTGVEPTLKLPIKKHSFKQAPTSAPKATQPVAKNPSVQKTEALLDEIRRLRGGADVTVHVEPPVAPQPTPSGDIMAETKSLMDKIASLKGDQTASSTTGADLLGKVQQTPADGNTDELLDQIKKLLDLSEN